MGHRAERREQSAWRKRQSFRDQKSENHGFLTLNFAFEEIKDRALPESFSISFPPTLVITHCKDLLEYENRLFPEVYS
jgi:hypothetical protein